MKRWFGSPTDQSLVRASITPRTPPCCSALGLVAVAIVHPLRGPFPSATELTHGGRDWSIVQRRDGFGGGPTPGRDARGARAAHAHARAGAGARRAHRPPRALLARRRQ